MGLTLSNESLGMKHIGQGKGILGLVLKKGNTYLGDSFIRKIIYFFRLFLAEISLQKFGRD